MLLLLSTGARISEVLRIDCADWGHERLTVIGKGDKERVVNATGRARDAVDEYLAGLGGSHPTTYALDTNTLIGEDPA